MRYSSSHREFRLRQVQLVGPTMHYLDEPTVPEGPQASVPALQQQRLNDASLLCLLPGAR